MRRRRTVKEKELQDNAHLLRQWKVWHREQLDEALACPCGDKIAALMDMLRHLAMGSSQALIDYVRTVDWNGVDYEHKLTILHEINSAITKLRERHELEPIDDPLPHQPDNVYRVLKSILTISRDSGEANRGISVKQQTEEKRHE